MTFAYPFALLFPLLIFGAALIRRRQTTAVLYPDVGLIKAVEPSLKLRLRKPVLGGLSALSVLFLSIAAARPQRLTYVEQPQLSRNIILALDISKSMTAQDFQAGHRFVSRLVAVKSVVSQFIKDRKNERIGIIVFGSEAFVQAPLTLDHTLVAQLVERLEPGLAGDGTAIGDGLGLSLKRIQDVAGASKAVVLMTDGVSNAGQVNPIKAAKVARELGIKVHTIGIGSKEGQIADVPGALFSRHFTTPVEFDEAALREIARLTGGQYFNAASLEGLEKVYQEIDELETSSSDVPAKEIPSELFVHYALAGLICYLIYVIAANSIFMKLP